MGRVKKDRRQLVKSAKAVQNNAIDMYRDTSNDMDQHSTHSQPHTTHPADDIPTDDIHADTASDHYFSQDESNVEYVETDQISSDYESRLKQAEVVWKKIRPKGRISNISLVGPIYESISCITCKSDEWSMHCRSCKTYECMDCHVKSHLEKFSHDVYQYDERLGLVKTQPPTKPHFECSNGCQLGKYQRITLIDLHGIDTY